MQGKKRPLMPNQLSWNSDTGSRVSVNPGSEKVDPVIPRRITRSATKGEGVDLMTDMQGIQGQKSSGIKKDNSKARNGGFTPDVEDIVTPVRIENKKNICISPFASAAASTSIVTDAISDCEGESLQL
jgi:hypothetical protein